MNKRKKVATVAVDREYDVAAKAGKKLRVKVSGKLKKVPGSA